MFQTAIIITINDLDGSISAPMRKLATPLMPKTDHPMIAFSNAHFFRFVKAWIKDKNNPPVTISPKAKKKGDILSKPVKNK